MTPWPATPDLLRLLAPRAERLEATAWDFPSFHSHYTLHDSVLAEVRLAPGDGMLVLIHWDLIWNARIPREFAQLVIGIPRVYAVEWAAGAWVQGTLSGAASTPVSETERLQMLESGSVDLRAYHGARDDVPPPFEDPGLTRTTFEVIDWSHLTVLHGSEIRFACLNDHFEPGPPVRV